MSDLRGVILEKGEVGPSVIPPKTSTSMLVFYNVKQSDIEEIFANTYIPYENYRSGTTLEYFESQGITEAKDSEYNYPFHRFISEFYRMAGQNTKLHVLFYTFSDGEQLMDDLSYLINQNFPENEEIRQIGIYDCNKISDTGEMVDGLSINTIELIHRAAILYEWSVENFRPFNILISKRNKDSQNPVANLRDGSIVNCPGVSYITGADLAFGDKTDLWFSSDIGTCLGTLAAAEVNQNIGDNEAFNLTDVNRDIFTSDIIADGGDLFEIDIPLQPLEDLGYIFPVKYVGLNGYRWNNDHVCTPIIIDAEGNMNEHTIAHTRTMNEISRALRKALIPKVKTRQPVDPKTGKLPTGVIKYFESLGDDVMTSFVNRGLISAGKTFVDPESDLLIEKTLKISWSIVPTGSVGTITGTLNLKNKI